MKESDEESYKKIERLITKPFLGDEFYLKELRNEFSRVRDDLQRRFSDLGFEESQIEVSDIWGNNKTVGLGVYENRISIEKMIEMLSGFSESYPEWAFTIFWDAEEVGEIDGVYYKGDFFYIQN